MNALLVVVLVGLGVPVVIVSALFVAGSVRFRRASAPATGGVSGFLEGERVGVREPIHEAEAAASARLAYVFAMYGMSDVQPVDKAEVDRAMDNETVRFLADQDDWVAIAAGDVAVMARDLMVELTGMDAVMVADMLLNRAAAAAGLASSDVPEGIDALR